MPMLEDRDIDDGMRSFSLERNKIRIQLRIIDHLRFLESMRSPDHTEGGVLAIARWDNARHSPRRGKDNIFLAPTFRGQEGNK